MCLWGAPSPVYKGGEEEEGRPQGVRPRGGLLLLVGVGFPLFLVQVGEGGGGGGEKEGGERRPLPLSNSDWGKGDTSHLLASPLLLSSFIYVAWGTP